jgi:hypothetical protein
MSYQAKDFLSPAADNPWMLDAATDWIAEAKGQLGDHNTGINLVAWANDNPEAAFSVIQTILELSANDEVLFTQVAAGPLESFLSTCPDHFFESVCQVARIDPRLRKALQHVWQCGMSDARYKRIRDFANERS